MMEEKKRHTYSLGVVLLALAVGLLAGVLFAPANDGGQRAMGLTSSNAMSDRLDVLTGIINSYYVDNVDYDSLSTVVLQSVLSSLDPHSTYLTPKEFDKEAELLQGRFEGIGLTLFWINDTLYASSVNKGSPAADAGIHPGDRILAVDTVKVSGVKLEGGVSSAVKMIRGPRFTKVTLTIDRKGWDTPKKIKVRRDIIRHASVPAAVMIDKTTGYVHVERFAESTASEFHAALLQLKGEGMKHLVLDLRSNGGGSLESAIEMADELLPKGDLIVFTEGAHQRRYNNYATSGGLFEEGGLTVLLNEFSASASEVVAGAVQDNDRGTIAGRRSFGKGLVQRQFDLLSGDAVLLTIARYYTPSGRCIQRPYDKGSDAYYMDYLNRILSDYKDADSLFNATVDTSQSFLTKNGRKVYGGGGIQPDIIIPYISDTNWIYYNRLLDEKVLEEVLYHQIHDHYADLMKKYPTSDVFVARYTVDDATWQRILSTADKKGIRRHQGCIQKYGQHIRNRYKALMADVLFDNNAFYRVSLRNDTELQRALAAKNTPANPRRNGK